MSNFFAPCGHPGTPVIGTFVACTVKGCDGRPKRDQLAEDVRDALAAHPVPAVKRWHLERPAGMSNSVLVLDEIDITAANIDEVVTAVDEATCQLRPGLYISVACPRWLLRFWWRNLTREIQRGQKRPTFDVFKNYVEGHTSNCNMIGLVFDCTPIKAEVKHGRLGRSLELVAEFDGRKYEHVDWL